ncbi:MAG: hypothetical protein R3240_02320, partial [Gammaproteobacteria bacterium]|nr:hypothetical protein [Gammaproteobacteria bacterium]
MALISRVLFAVLLLIGATARAETTTIATIDPLALEANWWNYFELTAENEPAELETRVNTLYTRLQELLKGMEAGQQSDFSGVIKKIKINLDQYIKLKLSKPQEIPQLPPVPDSYTVKEAVQKYIDWRKLKRELDLAEEDLS